MGRGAVTVLVVFLNLFAFCVKCMQKELTYIIKPLRQISSSKLIRNMYTVTKTCH